MSESLFAKLAIIRFIRPSKKVVLNKKGMTGVEFIISVVIVGLISVVLYDILREGLNTWKYEDVQVDVVQQARNAIEKMAREIRQCKIDSVTITSLDANRDRIQFDAPLELEQYDDVQTIVYEPLANGDLQRTVNYAAGGSDTNILAKNIKKLYFNQEYEQEIAIRLQVQQSTQTVNMATKVFPRNY